MSKKNTRDDDAVQALAMIDAPGFLADAMRGMLRAFLEAEMTEHVGAMRMRARRQPDGAAQRLQAAHPEASRRRGRDGGPQSRDGGFSTELFARYQRSERALVLAMMETCLKGVSARKVTEVTEALCGTSFSASTVSGLCRGA